MILVKLNKKKIIIAFYLILIILKKDLTCNIWIKIILQMVKLKYKIRQK